jgi:predicted Zn-dependent protease
MRDGFVRLCDELERMIEPGEAFLATFSGEESDFVRFNHDRIRQAGHVEQRYLSIDLIAGDRHAVSALTLTGDLACDRAAAANAIAEARARRAILPPDPYLLYSTSSESLVDEGSAGPIGATEAVRTIIGHGEGLDLVGIWASGPVCSGFASSFGQRSWHSVSTFSFDWSCYLRADRAVKCSYAGRTWDERRLGRKLDDARSALALLDRPSAAVAPGRYRAYLSPAAMEDLLGLVGWTGFSCKAHRTRTTPLLKLALGEAAFDPAVSISEDRVAGIAPRFTRQGFATAPMVPLIEAGRLQGTLVAPRSAKEFGLAVNAGEEMPCSLSMAGGTIAQDEVLTRLGDGLYIANVHYCNYSDPNACRVTGLTRFACFLVEGGEIVAPLPVMRFDDSLYGLLGERLIGITAEREHRLSTSTYGGRALAGMHVPGVIVDGLALTL